MRTIELNTTELRARASELRAGDFVLLSGAVYTARDAAHKRLFALLDQGLPLPFDIGGAVIYYAGPTQGTGDKPFGACGPTTSGRMDDFSPRLLDLGLSAMIGKGARSVRVKEAIVRNHAVYLCAAGGAGALIAECIKSAEEIAFDDLGCESVKLLQVEKMPLYTAIDSAGGDLFITGPEKYRREPKSNV